MPAEYPVNGSDTLMADRLAPNLARQLIDGLQTPLLVLGPDAAAAEPLYWNPAFLRLTGFAGDAFERDPLCWLSRPEALAAALRAARITPQQRLVVEGRDGAGQAVRWRLRVSALEPQAGGRPGGWLLECARAAAAEARRRSLVRDDTVSGMLDRSWFLEVCRHQMGGARRHGRRLAVMVFEIQAFDIYVETFGRNAANNCLRLVAHGIASRLRRATDLVARIGDATFAALAEDMTTGEVDAHLGRIADAVAALSIHHPRAPGARYVQVAAGACAGVPEGTGDIEEWLAAARQTAGAAGQRVVAPGAGGLSTG